MPQAQKKTKKRNNQKTQVVRAASMLPSKPAMPLSKIPQTNYASVGREKICAITDPFCAVARGAHWPDGLGYATVPYPNRCHIPLHVNTSTLGSITYITPVNLPWGCLKSLTAGTTTYTMDTSNTSITGSINLGANFSGYRVVTAGIVIRNLASVMNTRGYLIISRMSSVPAFGATIPAMVVSNPEVMTVPIVPGMEIPLVHRPLGTTSRDFLPFVTNVAITDPSWDVFKIEIVNGDSTGQYAIDVEVYYNYEMQLPENSLLSGIAPKSAIPKPHLIDTANKITGDLVSTIVPSVTRVGSYVLSKATQALATRLAGPAAGLLAKELMDGNI